MTHALEMQLIIAVMLMKTALGLPNTCLHYCNFPPENSSFLPGCNCYHQNVRKPQPATLKHITTLPEIKRVPQSSAEQSNHDDNISKMSKQYNRSGTYLPKLMEEIKEFPLHLYLDIDINSDNDNRPQLEELKNMFETFLTTEKKLSECINLHIYIFSNIDTINKTNTNRGRKVQNDNLSRQRLTEIQSKCDQPVSIIKQSIYQIKHFLSREDQTTEFIADEQDTVYTTDSYKEIKTQYGTNESGNVNDKYLDALSSNPTNSYNINDVTETAFIVPEKVNERFHKNDSERDGNHLLNSVLLDIKKSDITSTSSIDKDSTMYNKINPPVTTYPTDHWDLGSIHTTNRIVFSEKDMKIPRIITKELSNGTLVSVVDGYENIPNSDFISTDQDRNILSTPLKDATNHSTNLQNSINIDEIIPSEIVNIHGNLYFSFGEKQIPARFIQQADGELDVAIDGFSVCNQMLEHNTSNFMNSLCKCIIRKNCT